MKKFFIIAIISFLILIFINNYPEDNQQTTVLKTIKIGKTILSVEVADTDTTRKQGLSNRTNPTENGGMLFVFEKEGNYGFWMKNMNFFIDIAWLDKNKNIVHMEKNISPETYPKVFGSDILSLYVLETKANFFEKNKIKIGDFVEF